MSKRYDSSERQEYLLNRYHLLIYKHVLVDDELSQLAEIYRLAKQDPQFDEKLNILDNDLSYKLDIDDTEYIENQKKKLVNLIANENSSLRSQNLDDLHLNRKVLKILKSIKFFPYFNIGFLAMTFASACFVMHAGNNNFRQMQVTEPTHRLSLVNEKNDTRIMSAGFQVDAFAKYAEKIEYEALENSYRSQVFSYLIDHNFDVVSKDVIEKQLQYSNSIENKLSNFENSLKDELSTDESLVDEDDLYEIGKSIAVSKQYLSESKQLAYENKQWVFENTKSLPIDSKKAADYLEKSRICENEAIKWKNISDSSTESKKIVKDQLGYTEYVGCLYSKSM